ncbi:hypothetical protein WDU94_006144 [Cyamophila willieti]
MVLNKSFSRVQVAKGNVAVSPGEIGKNTHYNNLKQIEESSFPNAYSTGFNPNEIIEGIISSEHEKDISLIDENILEIETYRDSNNATGTFVGKLRTGIDINRFENKPLTNHKANKALKVILPRKNSKSHVENNEMRHLNPDINYSVEDLNDSTSSCQTLTKKPKYIIMKISGENKVYKLIDDSFDNELPVDIIQSKKTFLIDSLSKSKQPINNSTSKQRMDTKLIGQQNERTNNDCNAFLDYSQRLPNNNIEKKLQNITTRKKSIDELNAKPNIKINPAQIVKTTHRFENNANISNEVQTKTMPTEDRGLLKGKSAIKDLINKIQTATKKQNQLLVNTNLEPTKTNENNFHSQTIIKNVKESDDQDINKDNNEKSMSITSGEPQIGTSSAPTLNKKLAINSKALPQTKTFNLPIKNKIVRFIPMYPNKGMSPVFRRNSLDENLLKVGINNNILPLKQIRAELRNGIQESQVQTDDSSKSHEIKTNNGVQTIVINKNEKDSTKSLLETNKLILDILNKNKIKKIILGCKNKEIFRKDINTMESSALKDVIQNATTENINAVIDHNQQNVIKVDGPLSNILENENISLKNRNNHSIEQQQTAFSIGNKTIHYNIKGNNVQNNTKAIVDIGRLLGNTSNNRDKQNTCEKKGNEKAPNSTKETSFNRVEDEIESERTNENVIASIEDGRTLVKVVDGKVIVEENRGLVPVMKDNIELIEEQSRGAVDSRLIFPTHWEVTRNIQQSGGTVERNIGKALEAVERKHLKKMNVGVLQKIVPGNQNGGGVDVSRNSSVDDLDSLCDVIQLFQCKLCSFKNHEKQSFVHHLKSSHDKAMLGTEGIALGKINGKHAEPSDNMEGKTEGTCDIEQRASIGTETSGPSEMKHNNKVPRQKIAPIDDISEFNSWRVDPICDVKPFRCPLRSCSVTLSSQSSLDIHTVCHQSEGFKCSQESCSDVFSTWGPCKSHLYEKHDIECDLITCPVPTCTYVCSTRSQLGSHLKHHARVHKRHACESCDAVYRTRAMLLQHVTREHKKKRKQKQEGDRWYTMKQCLLCLRTYSDIKCLKKHIREVHKRLKPFQCAVCGFSTGRKASLQLHVRQHTQEKPYACDKCDFRTGDHNILRKHIQRHMPVKKYQCTVNTCSFSCTELYRLKSHLAAKHTPRFIDELSEKLNIVSDEEEENRVEDEAATIPNNTEENTIFYYTVH